jgi:hypothetical protein
MEKEKDFQNVSINEQFVSKGSTLRKYKIFMQTGH